MNISFERFLSILAVVLLTVILVVSCRGKALTDIDEFNMSTPSFGIMENAADEEVSAVIVDVETPKLEHSVAPAVEDATHTEDLETRDDYIEESSDDIFEYDFQDEEEDDPYSENLETKDDYIEESSDDIFEYDFQDEDVYTIARTLAGECYDDMIDDKIKVAEVIVNRVSNGFGNSVMEVVTAPGQFHGYWWQSRDISNNDIEVARDVLNRWYQEGNKPLSSYLYFYAGAGKENIFSDSY